MKNEKCLTCANKCKQSNKVIIHYCPLYTKKEENTSNKGLHIGK